jgi:hypothetical protein
MNSVTPTNTKLPFITYGSFKPLELRFNIIKDYIENYSEIRINGIMEEKDGVPIFELSKEGYSGQEYVAFELNFKVGFEDVAYKTICDYEPASYYEWGVLNNKNILVGNKKLRGKNYFFGNSWTFKNDPYFEFGLKACQTIYDIDSINKFNESEFFPFFKSSAAYMLLWTIIERFCTLKYGADISPADKIKALASDISIPWEEIINKIDRVDRIYRSDKVNEPLSLDKTKGVKKILGYYYGIRSNMVHRGKEVFSDTDKIKESFHELIMIFKNILNSHGMSEFKSGI